MSKKKQREIELDVDFIGGDGPLTPEEEKLLSEYFQQRKLERQKLEDEKKPATKARSTKSSPRGG